MRMKITDWLKAQAFRILDKESKRVGFMYTIYGDEISITTRPGVSRPEIEAFLNSIPAKLEAELSRYGVARLKQSLVEDERAKVLGGYFGVDLMVFDAQGKDLKQALKEITESAELYDPDFNGARIWVPRIQLAIQSINEFLTHEKVSAADPAELYQKVLKHLNTLLKPAKEKQKLPPKETILNAGAKEIIDKQFPVLNKTAFVEIAKRTFRRGLIGKIRVYSYRHKDLNFTSFKELNDHFGSTIGDEVIRLLAYALSRSFGEKALLSREPVPPDQFVFMFDIPRKSFVPATLGHFLEAAQASISNLSEVTVAFEVSLISCEEGDLTLLDKISRAEANVARIIFPTSGN